MSDFVRDILPSEEEAKILRGRDGLVHIARRDVAGFRTFPDGTVAGDGFVVFFTCGARCKLGASRRNHFTEKPVTCITCLGGGYP